MLQTAEVQEPATVSAQQRTTLAVSSVSQRGSMPTAAAPPQPAWFTAAQPWRSAPDIPLSPQCASHES